MQVSKPADPAPVRGGQAGTLAVVLIIGVVATLGIVIFNKLNGQIPLPSGHHRATATEVQQGFALSVELIPLIFVALLALFTLTLIARM